MAHSPGPWEFRRLELEQEYPEDPEGNWYVESEVGPVAMLIAPSVDTSEFMANGHLLAAAPRLLAALEAMIADAYSFSPSVGRWFCRYCERSAHKKNGIKHKEGCLVTEARAALAAARGEEE